MQFPEIDIAIEAGQIICMDGAGTIVHNGTILIQKDRIIYAGEKLRRDEYQSAKVLDGSNSVVLPPFFNQHTHPSLSLYRGLGVDLPLDLWLERVIWPLERKFSSAEMVALGTQLSVLEMIRGGIGAAATMDYHTRAVGEVFEKAGLRAFLGEAIFSDPTPSCRTPESAFEYTEELVSRYRDSELIHVYMAIHAPMTSTPELFQKASIKATQLGIKSTSHIAETRKELQWSLEKFGVSPVELINRTGILDTDFILIHGVHLLDDDIRLLAQKDIPVIHNPHSNMVLGSGVCRVPDLLASGIRVGLGTDSAASNNGLSMLQEMQTMSKLQKAFWKKPTTLPSGEALRIATQRGYDIYGLKETGQIKPGFKADLQIIDLERPHVTPDYDSLSTIVYSSKQDDISTLIVNGKILMENRVVRVLDEEVILKECRKMGREIGRYYEKLT